MSDVGGEGVEEAQEKVSIFQATTRCMFGGRESLAEAAEYLALRKACSTRGRVVSDRQMIESTRWNSSRLKGLWKFGVWDEEGVRG